jgi:molecular chaperone DnaK
MDAARMAGLDVLRIINAPTAAALAYAVDGRVRGNVLVYDLGGGTFDVSVVEIASPTNVRVLSSEGDHQLGGKDLDRALATHLSETFEQKHGIPLTGDPGVELRTAEEAEKTRKHLSRLQPVSGIDLLHQGRSMPAKVTRETHASLINAYVGRTEMLVEDALVEAGLKPADIDSVLLVGGSSRIPAVQKMLQRHFGRAPQMAINPEEAVALGAALQAGILMQQQGLIAMPGAAGRALQRTRVQDVSPHSYGMISIGEALGRVALRNTVIIPKNTPLPCSKSDSLYTTAERQPHVTCRVTQGEDDDPEFVTVVYEAKLELPPDRPANQEVRVTFTYDANGRMACTLVDVGSGLKSTVDLDAVAESKVGDKTASLDGLDLDDRITG